MIKRALISTSDKSNLVSFASFLKEHNVEILATGGTAKLLQENNIDITYVSDYTGFPEILGGRVKTLHPKIHGALLHRGDEDAAQLAEHEIAAIDLVVVNLYPFAAAVAKNPDDVANVIENIDIGGPTMIRAAAKNYKHVTVATDPSDYETIKQLLLEKKEIDLETRCKLAGKAFAAITEYDQMISNYFATQLNNKEAKLPENLALDYQLVQSLRYGENPQQAAGVYKTPAANGNALATCEPLQGKALSYNNLLDSDCAVRCVRSLQQPACVIVKHASPCGVAEAATVLDSYKQALAADPLSAFGGIVAFNTALDVETAKEIVASQFAEVILAPEVSAEALEVFSAKKNLRVVATTSTCPGEGAHPTSPSTRPTSPSAHLTSSSAHSVSPSAHTVSPSAHPTSRGLSAGSPEKELMLHSIDGGLLVQEYDTTVTKANDLRLVTKAKCNDKAIADVLFADNVCKYIKSNAIVLVKNKQTIGIGVGQPSRVMSLQIAILKAKEAGFDLQGAVMASDAFFPFPDCVEMAAKEGINIVVQPGGSVRDEEVIATCDKNNIAMFVTGVRHFRH